MKWATMPDALLKQLIERASDSLADLVYQRLVEDRRRMSGQADSSGSAPAWDQIAVLAVQESTFTQAEADELLRKLQEGLLLLPYTDPPDAAPSGDTPRDTADTLDESSDQEAEK